MHETLNRNLYLVKEHVGMFKAASNYDIYDPESGEIILECREEKLGSITKILRFTKYKRMTPFHSEIRTPQGETLIQVQRGVSFFLSKVKVMNGDGQVLGGFKQKLFSIGGAFNVLNPNDEVVCTLKGKWTGWNFKFATDDLVFAQVSKKWAGIGRELLTSADNYVLKIEDHVPSNHATRPLILAAVMCIDLVLKE